MKINILWVLLCISKCGIGDGQSRVQNDKPNIVECGYKQCPHIKEGALNVHIIAHSHMDAGWVKTFDQYYYGSNSQMSAANVQLIYHSVLSELLHDSRRKFTFSESSFFWRWWLEQRPATRKTFRTLVREGRIEFAGGGYVQGDEATTHYASIIDQFTWGLRKLNDTLGPCGRPKAAWQIDTYGHSREAASLLAQMGFDGLFLGRVDHRRRRLMMEADRMEAVWRGSDVLGRMSDIMTHTLYNLYNAPDGFCFDFLCSDDPIVDDPASPAYNADTRVEEFVAQLERQASYYDSDHILVTMGGDFAYQSAASWYMNIDKLISLINARQSNLTDINIFYSTPSCYLKALYLHNQRERVYLDRSDHLPYGSDAGTYWTGFYSSRPSVKYLERVGYNLMQITKQLAVLTKTSNSTELLDIRHSMALLQHHDAITGTSKQQVINDYMRVLTQAMSGCRDLASNHVAQLTDWFGGRRSTRSQHAFTLCHQLNVSRCQISEIADDFLVVAYNPTSDHVTHHVRLPVASHNIVKQITNISVVDSNNLELEHQRNALSPADLSISSHKPNAVQELWFEAHIPPMGYSSFRVSVHGVRGLKKAVVPLDTHAAYHFIANQFLKVSINKNTGLLQSIQTSKGLKLEISQRFMFYTQGHDRWDKPASGAYCFRPQGEAETVTDSVQYKIVRGLLVKEIRQVFSDWLSQVIRLYRGEDFVELEWVVGPVPYGSEMGKEVITRFYTNLTTSGTFYTDSNGRQMMRRSCSEDPHSSNTKLKPLAACYYPVTSRASLRDPAGGVELAVLTDRSQGVTSYREGELEFMIHRRLLTDDKFGLDEPLNELGDGSGLVVKGTHRLLFGTYRQLTEQLSFSERAARLSRRTLNTPALFLAPADGVSPRKWQRLKSKQFSALKPQGLPPHAHILTLEPWRGNSVLLRLENTMEKDRNGKPDSEEPQPQKVFTITVDLRRVFHMRLKWFRETTLAANQWLDEARQMDWSSRFSYDEAEDNLTKDVKNSKQQVLGNERRNDLRDDVNVEVDYVRPKDGRNLRKQPKPLRERMKRSIDNPFDIESKEVDVAINLTSLMENIVNNSNTKKSVNFQNLNITDKKEIVKKRLHSEQYDVLKIINGETQNDTITLDHKVVFNASGNITKNIDKTPVHDDESNDKIEIKRDGRASETKIEEATNNETADRLKVPTLKTKAHDHKDNLGSKKGDENLLAELPNIKRRRHYRRGPNARSRNKQYVEDSKHEIDDGVTRPMFEMYNIQNYKNNLGRFKNRQVNWNSKDTEGKLKQIADYSRNSRRVGNTKRRNNGELSRKYIHRGDHKSKDRITITTENYKQVKTKFSDEELPFDDDDDDLEDFLSNLKKIEDIADALEGFRFDYYV